MPKLLAEWRKSSFSADSANCVEVRKISMDWRKSSKSNGNGGNNCVEVRLIKQEKIGVRHVLDESN